MWWPEALAGPLIFRAGSCLAARLSRRVGRIPRALVSSFLVMVVSQTRKCSRSAGLIWPRLTFPVTVSR
jgi:hypothetical protein